MRAIQSASRCSSLALSLLLVMPLFSAAAEEADKGNTADADAGYALQLDKARKSIDEGNPTKAMTEYLDPLIAQFEARVKPDGPRLYSANSPTEALFYAALAATAVNEKGGKGAEVLSGTWSTAVFLKGYALVEAERLDEAKAAFMHAVEIAPMSPGPWNELGNIYQTQKNWPDALDAYKNAESGANIVFDSDSKEVNTRLTRALRGQGYALTEMGKLGESEALYQRCLKLDPDDKVAKQELAYIKDLRTRKK